MQNSPRYFAAATAINQLNRYATEIARPVMSQSPSEPRNSVIEAPQSADSQSDMALESVVTIELGQDPQKYKYAGKNSTQVLAKSAEDLFMDSEIRIDVMKFFCPLLNYAEEISIPTRRALPLVDREVAAPYIDGERPASAA